MATIRIEADMSAEQLLHAVEQLPPQEFTAFLGQLLARVRDAAHSEVMSAADRGDAVMPEQPAGPNPYLAAAGMFADDSFADQIDAFLTEWREREEAAR
jgi:hypothetical protein